MKKAKMIIGSLVVAGIVAAGGAMVKSKAEVNTNDSMEELVKKKKHKKKKKNNNYQQSNFYQNGNWNNGKQVDDFTITANRDYYLRVTESGVTEVTVTGIQSTRLTAASSDIYDLQGRRVGKLGDAMPKGLYIVNGKKCVIH